MDKLAVLEEEFFKLYPNGFEDEEIQAIAKKHRVNQISDLTQDLFAQEAFADRKKILENYLKIVNKSSLVSRFEKPTFNTFMSHQTEDSEIVDALYELIYGDERKGFEWLNRLLQVAKLNKWPILTVLKAYLNPHEDVLIKPTTVKMILNYFEVKDVVYSSKPNFEFYKQYRIFLNQIKSQASESLKPNNMAFSGFLMMALDL